MRNLLLMLSQFLSISTEFLSISFFICMVAGDCELMSFLLICLALVKHKIDIQKGHAIAFLVLVCVFDFAILVFGSQLIYAR